MSEALERVSPAASAAAATAAPFPARRAVPAHAWIRLLRPRQWVKNTFVLAPLLFSGRLGDAAALLDSFVAFTLFCLLASGIYAWNDVADRAEDRAHPTKRNRPVASGAISPRAAIVTGLLLVVTALTGGWLLAPAYSAILGGYLLLNVLYTLHLKSVVILDVFAIAAFFILRLLAGCVAIAVVPSVWLLLCGGLLALYLGFAKRRHELELLGGESHRHRAVLRHYDAALLDQMSGILLAVTIVSYIMYTLTSGTAAVVGEMLSYSVVFVLYGVFRYLWLCRQSNGNGGADPTETLLTDTSLLVTVVFWLGYCAWAIYRPF